MMRKSWTKWILIAVIALALIVGVPIIINECYKTNSGYMTIWGAADALSYYGTILGSLVAVATVVVTILFTYKQIQRYQVNANICLDQILTSLDSADYRKVRTLSNSMERAREKFCQVMQNRAEIYEKLFRVNEKEIAERILEVEKQEQKSLPIRVRMRCQEAVARAHGLNFDELKIELEQLNEATAKMHADIFRPLLQLKQRTFELIRTELSQKADRILNFGGDTHADT